MLLANLLNTDMYPNLLTENGNHRERREIEAKIKTCIRQTNRIQAHTHTHKLLRLSKPCPLLFSYNTPVEAHLETWLLYKRKNLKKKKQLHEGFTNLVNLLGLI